MDIRTRILILSDTHGDDFTSGAPLPAADVAIHCGDLTEESKLDEFGSALRQLAAIDAPLKLVIAGNHDFTLDTPSFRAIIDESVPALDPSLVKKTYGDFGESRALFSSASAAASGIRLLDEGTHELQLGNGALLRVYASPYTPALGPSNMGFQYDATARQHDFDICPGAVDVVVTHGPPRGVLDQARSRQRGGSAELFAAVARARPRLHCFGHIHEGWGGKLVAWRDAAGTGTETDEEQLPSTHFTAIDNGRSVVVETLARLRRWHSETEEEEREREGRVERYVARGCCATSHCATAGDSCPLEAGRETLFVNAAMRGSEAGTGRVPWLVDIELPSAKLSEGRGL